ncbi:MAG: LPS assembly lipoprotein LptE [Candidatus Sumerlaeaceae bacterium]
MIWQQQRSIARLVTLGVLMLVCMSSMAVIPPAQRLPTHIKRIYIREFKNNSRWFGAQADLTLYVNDEFMLDGRLDVVQSERADVRLEGKITNVTEKSSGFGNDQFPLISTVQIVCTLELWDPYDSDRLVPLARYSVPTVVQYVSDPRRSISETQTEARDRLLRQAARNIVLAVINNRPAPERPIDTANRRRYEQRRGAGKYEPEILEPRFPKPTPVSGSSRRDSDEEVLESYDSTTTTSTIRRSSK